MPRSQGTSRKGKPGKHDRASGMGKSLQKHRSTKYTPRSDGKSRTGDGGMHLQPGVESVGVVASEQQDGGKNQNKTRSVLEMNDLDDFLTQASMAGREFASEREGLVVLDSAASAYQGGPSSSSVQWEDLPQPASASTSSNKNTTTFEFQELSVPRRPAWNSSTTKGELEAAERHAFLEWRRGIAVKEEQLLKQQQQQQSSASTATATSNIAVTPFEKNLEVWRQLWRVLERSACLLQLVDARNPLFYLSEDLRAYAQSLGKGKPMMVLVNKSDYLSAAQRAAWRDSLQKAGWSSVVFFSAVSEQQKLDQAAAEERRREQDAQDGTHLDGNEGGDPENTIEEEIKESSVDDNHPDGAEGQKKEEISEVHMDDEGEEEGYDGTGVHKLLTREQLMETMLTFARANNCQPDPRYDNRVQFGFIGFPVSNTWSLWMMWVFVIHLLSVSHTFIALQSECR